MRLLCFIAIGAASLAQTVEFNREVRPILSDRCFACHGPDNNNRKANLRLDRAGDAAVGRRVMERVRSTNTALRMPPAYLGHAPLKDAEIATLARWVDQGMPYEKHWSFIAPVKRPVAAGVHPVDHFIRAKLGSAGLAPSPRASKETLLRRVSLDLTGLAASPEEIESFLADNSPGAFDRVVDRLLASRRYAERMTIRWLEAARYADTNGYQTDGERSMWRWRDWVLEAFLRNMPFDRFTVEQLAGDLLPSPTRDQIIATGFHRNHRTTAEGGIIDEEFRVEYVADRAETTSTVWLGLTTGCARCHDHKYDPISQKEYYQLFAFFNQVPEKGFVFNFGNEEPYVPAPTPEQEKTLAGLDAALARAKAAWEALDKWIRKAAAKYKVPDGWVSSEGLVFRHAGGRFDGGEGIKAGFEKTKLNFTDPFTFAATVTPSEGDGAIVSKYEDYWEGTGHGLYLVEGKVRLHIVFRWTDLGMRVETTQPLKPGQTYRIIATYDGKRKPGGVHIYVDGVEQELKVLFNELSWPIESKEPFRIGAGGGKRFRGEIRDVAVWTRALTSAEMADRQRFAWLELAAPAEIKKARADLAAAQRERDRFFASIPTVMVMKDQPGIRKSYVLKRGAYDAHGEEVRADVPSALPGLAKREGANRLDLARWIVSPENPLTARVIVNRIWQMLFGTGLVKTVEDLGSQGEWPIHPELLDWLAVEFRESGWDLKKLLRLIVTSQTYQQSSRVTPDMLAKDPENRYYARAPRMRLAAEMIRDHVLNASGLLVEKFGGPSVKPTQPDGLWQELAGGSGYKPDDGEGRYRRSVYTYWRRTIQPPSMVTFDSPTRETCSVRESRTNTPLQALNLLNDPAYLEAAQKMGERMKVTADPIRTGFLLAVGRTPTAKEREIASAAHARSDSWAQVAALLLNLDEALTKE